MKPPKKLIVASAVACAATASALAQGTVIFENSASSGNIYLNSVSAANYAAGGTYTVALLWAAGTTVVPQAQMTQIALYGLATGGATSTGFFTDAATITTGAATVGGTAAIFEVQGWTGNFTSYAAAAAGGAHFLGQTAEFVNGTGNPHPPATPPVQTTGWDGNLILLNTDPEPSTIAIAGAGAGLLWYARRKKQTEGTRP